MLMRQTPVAITALRIEFLASFCSIVLVQFQFESELHLWTVWLVKYPSYAKYSVIVSYLVVIITLNTMKNLKLNLIV